MNIYQMIGRNLDITEAMKTYAEDKLEKLERFSDQIVDARVVMAYDSKNHADAPAKVEVQLNVPNGVVRAEERGLDSYAAIDKVVDKLERQLKRFKDRSQSRRVDVPEFVEESPESEGPRLVRTKRHVLRPMTPEDAAMQMDALGHDFYMFHNAETNLISVIYLRDDGHYGLIEPGN
ncbi:MAG: ribosome-associated translation inhibitor RaiA [Trueperaceae bacterium]|nr:ribosome-associated translation inhibitor RaiA [Trueperaceae bacterium]